MRLLETLCWTSLLCIGCLAVPPLARPQAVDVVAEADRHPDSFENNARAGEYFIAHKQFERAVRYLSKAAALSSQAAEISYDLALAYLKTGNLVQAKNVIVTALEHHNTADFHNLLGDIEDRQGNLQDAAKEFEAAARIDPTEKNVFDLGNYLLNHGSFAGAQTVFTWAASQFPKSAQIRMGLGVAQYSQGHYREAVLAFCDAADLDPHDTRALGFLGKVYAAAPDVSGAAADRLKHFAHEFPGNAEAQFYYALTIKDSGSATDTKSAEQHFRKAISLQPAFADAHFQLGTLLEAAGRTSEAISEYETAAKLAPNQRQFHYRLAQLYTRIGRRDLASQQFQQVKQLSNVGR
jgi:Flp pilus assembly protein TadD